MKSSRSEIVRAVTKASEDKIHKYVQGSLAIVDHPVYSLLVYKEADSPGLVEINKVKYFKEGMTTETLFDNRFVMDSTLSSALRSREILGIHIKKKIPLEIISMARKIMQVIFDTHRTEGGVLLTYNSATDTFGYSVPVQKVSSTLVDIEKKDLDAEFKDPNVWAVASVHSHPFGGGNKFLSGTDHAHSECIPYVPIASFNFATSKLPGSTKNMDIYSYGAAEVELHSMSLDEQMLFEVPQIVTISAEERKTIEALIKDKVKCNSYSRVSSPYEFPGMSTYNPGWRSSEGNNRKDNRNVGAATGHFRSPHIFDDYDHADSYFTQGPPHKKREAKHNSSTTVDRIKEEGSSDYLRRVNPYAKACKTILERLEFLCPDKKKFRDYTNKLQEVITTHINNLVISQEKVKKHLKDITSVFFRGFNSSAKPISKDDMIKMVEAFSRGYNVLLEAADTWNNVDGDIFKHIPEDFLEDMDRALYLAEAECEKLSGSLRDPYPITILERIFLFLTLNAALIYRFSTDWINVVVPFDIRSEIDDMHADTFFTVHPDEEDDMEDTLVDQVFKMLRAHDVRCYVETFLDVAESGTSKKDAPVSVLYSTVLESIAEHIVMEDKPDYQVADLICDFPAFFTEHYRNWLTPIRSK